MISYDDWKTTPPRHWFDDEDCDAFDEPDWSNGDFEFDRWRDEQTEPNRNSTAPQETAK